MPGPTKFDPSSARRIASAVQDFERRPRNRLDPKPTPPRLAGGAAIKFAQTTQLIAKATDKTRPKAGGAKLQSFKDSPLTPTKDVTVYNPLVDKSIASGAMCVVALIDNKWVVIGVDGCASLV